MHGGMEERKREGGPGVRMVREEREAGRKGRR